MAIRSNPDLQTWGVFDLLLTEAKRITLERPVDAVDLAYAALAVTDLLDPRAYSEERIHDLRASAWAAIGNAKRMAGDFPGAGEALRTASETVELGTGDTYEKVNVLSMTASLVTDLGEFERGAKMLAKAAALARTVRDRPLEGRLKIQQAGAIGWEDPARGLKLAERGLSLLRRSKSDDKHTELGGIHLTALWAAREHTATPANLPGSPETTKPSPRPDLVSQQILHASSPGSSGGRSADRIARPN